jgi:flagellar hook-associated protein 3 FlgL
MDISRNYSLRDALTRRSVEKLQERLSQVQEQTSTGKRVNRPSDDPHAAARISALKALDEKHAQYDTNIESARNWLHQSEGELTKLSDILQNARQMATKARNPNYNADDLERMGTEVQTMIDDVENILNSRHNSTGEYIFAGTDTTVAPQPLEIDGTNTATYNGNTTAPKRHVGADTTIPVSVHGQDILDVDGSGVDLIDRLDNLRTALDTSDQAQLQESIEELKSAHDHVVDLTADLGTQGTRMQVVQDYFQDASLANNEHRADLEEIDLTKAFTDLQRLQTNYQASLRVTSSILNRSSLVDYL